MTQERFSDPALLILTSLADGERHGYAIMEDVKTSFDVQLGPGTLYGTLARLEERGLIGLVIEPAQPSASSTGLEQRQQSRQPRQQRQQRRPYRLTEMGRTVLGEELKRLSHLTQVAQGRLGKVATAA
ncbi:MAG: PadR family transcriptional regulator [Armatimonadota bacterium]